MVIVAVTNRTAVAALATIRAEITVVKIALVIAAGNHVVAGAALATIHVEIQAIASGIVGRSLCHDS